MKRKRTSYKRAKIDPQSLQIYSCHLCGQKFQRGCGLASHIRKHEAKVYKCSQCDFESKYRKAFDSHTSLGHSVRRTGPDRSARHSQQPFSKQSSNTAESDSDEDDEDEDEEEDEEEEEEDDDDDEDAMPVLVSEAERVVTPVNNESRSKLVSPPLLTPTRPLRHSYCPVCPLRFETKSRAAFHMQVHRQKTWRVSKTARNCQERRMEERTEGLLGRRDPRFYFTKSGVVRGRGFPLNSRLMSKWRYHYEKRCIFQKRALLWRFMSQNFGHSVRSMVRTVERQEAASSSSQTRGEPPAKRARLTRSCVSGSPPRSTRSSSTSTLLPLLSKRRRAANLPAMRSKKLRMTSGVAFCQNLRYNNSGLYLCRSCPYVTWNTSSIWHHFRHHIMKSTESYNCTNCTYSSVSHQNIEQHIKMHMFKNDESHAQYVTWLRYERDTNRFDLTFQNSRAQYLLKKQSSVTPIPDIEEITAKVVNKLPPLSMHELLRPARPSDLSLRHSANLEPKPEVKAEANEERPGTSTSTARTQMPADRIARPRDTPKGINQKPVVTVKPSSTPIRADPVTRQKIGPPLSASTPRASERISRSVAPSRSAISDSQPGETRSQSSSKTVVPSAQRAVSSTPPIWVTRSSDRTTRSATLAKAAEATPKTETVTPKIKISSRTVDPKAGVCSKRVEMSEKPASKPSSSSAASTPKQSAIVKRAEAVPDSFETPPKAVSEEKRLEGTSLSTESTISQATRTMTKPSETQSTSKYPKATAKLAATTPKAVVPTTNLKPASRATPQPMKTRSRSGATSGVTPTPPDPTLKRDESTMDTIVSKKASLGLKRADAKQVESSPEPAIWKPESTSDEPPVEPVASSISTPISILVEPPAQPVDTMEDAESWESWETIVRRVSPGITTEAPPNSPISSESDGEDVCTVAENAEVSDEPLEETVPTAPSESAERSLKRTDTSIQPAETLTSSHDTSSSSKPAIPVSAIPVKPVNSVPQAADEPLKLKDSSVKPAKATLKPAAPTTQESNAVQPAVKSTSTSAKPAIPVSTSPAVKPVDSVPQAADEPLKLKDSSLKPAKATSKPAAPTAQESNAVQPAVKNTSTSAKPAIPVSTSPAVKPVDSVPQAADEPLKLKDSSVKPAKATSKPAAPTAQESSVVQRAVKSTSTSAKPAIPVSTSPAVKPVDSVRQAADEPLKLKDSSVKPAKATSKPAAPTTQESNAVQRAVEKAETTEKNSKDATGKSEVASKQNTRTLRKSVEQKMKETESITVKTTETTNSANPIVKTEKTTLKLRSSDLKRDKSPSTSEPISSSKCIEPAPEQRESSVKTPARKTRESTSKRSEKTEQSSTIPKPFESVIGSSVVTPKFTVTPLKPPATPSTPRTTNPAAATLTETATPVEAATESSTRTAKTDVDPKQSEETKTVSESTSNQVDPSLSTKKTPDDVKETPKSAGTALSRTESAKLKQSVSNLVVASKAEENSERPMEAAETSKPPVILNETTEITQSKATSVAPQTKVAIQVATAASASLVDRDAKHTEAPEKVLTIDKKAVSNPVQLMTSLKQEPAVPSINAVTALNQNGKPSESTLATLKKADTKPKKVIAPNEDHSQLTPTSTTEPGALKSYVELPDEFDCQPSTSASLQLHSQPETREFNLKNSYSQPKTRMLSAEEMARLMEVQEQLQSSIRNSIFKKGPDAERDLFVKKRVSFNPEVTVAGPSRVLTPPREERMNPDLIKRPGTSGVVPAASLPTKLPASVATPASTGAASKQVGSISVATKPAVSTSVSSPIVSTSTETSAKSSETAQTGIKKVKKVKKLKKLKKLKSGKKIRNSGVKKSAGGVDISKSEDIKNESTATKPAGGGPPRTEAATPVCSAKPVPLQVSEVSTESTLLPKPGVSTKLGIAVKRGVSTSEVSTNSLQMASKQGISVKPKTTVKSKVSPGHAEKSASGSSASRDPSGVSTKSKVSSEKAEAQSTAKTSESTTEVAAPSTSEADDDDPHPFRSSRSLLAALAKINLKPRLPFNPKPTEKDSISWYHQGISALEMEFFRDLVPIDPTLPTGQRVVTAKPAVSSKPEAKKGVSVAKKGVSVGQAASVKPSQKPASLDKSAPSMTSGAVANTGTKTTSAVSKSGQLKRSLCTDSKGEGSSGIVTKTSKLGVTSKDDLAKVTTTEKSFIKTPHSQTDKKADVPSSSGSMPAIARNSRSTVVKSNRNQSPPTANKDEKASTLLSPKNGSKPEVSTNQTMVRSHSDMTSAKTGRMMAAEPTVQTLKRTTRSLSRMQRESGSVVMKESPKSSGARSSSKSRSNQKFSTPEPAGPSSRKSSQDRPSQKEPTPEAMPMRKRLRDVPSRRPVAQPEKESSPPPKKQKFDSEPVFKVPQLPPSKRCDQASSSTSKSDSASTSASSARSSSKYDDYVCVIPPFVPEPKKTKKQLQEEQAEKERRAQPDWQEEPFVEPVFDPHDMHESIRINKRDPPFPKFEDFLKLEPVPPHYYTERHPNEAHQLFNKAVRDWWGQLHRRYNQKMDLWMKNKARWEIGLPPLEPPEPPRPPTEIEAYMMKEITARRLRQCPDCSYSNYKSLEEFRSHRDHHHFGGSHQCRECNFRAYRKVDIHKHMWFHHYLPDARRLEGIESSDAEDEPEPPPPPKRKRPGRRRRRNNW